MDSKHLPASDGTGDAALMHITANRSIGATTIVVDTVTGIPSFFIATYGTLLGTGFIDPTTKEDFYGHVDTGNLIIDGFAPGSTDGGNTSGQVVVIKPNTLWANLIAQHVNPTGTVQPYAGSSAPSGWLICDGSAVSRTTYAPLFAILGSTFGAGDGSTTFNIPNMLGRGPIGVGTNTWKFTFASTDVNTTTDQIVVTASPELITGRKVQLTTTGTLPTGLSLATDYYLIVIDTTHVQLASSLANAVAGTQIDITGAGSGTNTATHTGTARTLGQHGGEEGHATTINEMPAHTHTQNWSNASGSAAAGAVLGNNGGTVTGSTGGSAAHNNMQPWLALNYIIKV